MMFLYERKIPNGTSKKKQRKTPNIRGSMEDIAKAHPIPVIAISEVITCSKSLRAVMHFAIPPNTSTWFRRSPISTKRA